MYAKPLTQLAMRWLTHAPADPDKARRTLRSLRPTVAKAGTDRERRVWNACWVLVAGQPTELIDLE